MKQWCETIFLPLFLLFGSGMAYETENEEKNSIYVIIDKNINVHFIFAYFWGSIYDDNCL